MRRKNSASRSHRASTAEFLGFFSVSRRPRPRVRTAARRPRAWLRSPVCTPVVRECAPMSYDDLLGRLVTLPVRRFSSPGAFLALDAEDVRPDAPTLLLPGAEVPEGTRE